MKLPEMIHPLSNEGCVQIRSQVAWPLMRLRAHNIQSIPFAFAYVQSIDIENSFDSRTSKNIDSQTSVLERFLDVRERFHRKPNLLTDVDLSDDRVSLQTFQLIHQAIGLHNQSPPSAPSPY